MERIYVFAYIKCIVQFFPSFEEEEKMKKNKKKTLGKFFTVNPQQA